MKKLLIATDNFLPRWDGIARFLSEIIPRLSKHFEITVLAPDFGELEQPTNYRLVRFPLSKVLVFGGFPFAKPDVYAIKKRVKESDIVFTQTIGPVCSKTIIQAKKQKKPLVSFMHSVEYELAAKATKGFLKKYAGNFVKKRSKKLYKKCNFIIVPSQEEEEIISWLNIGVSTKIIHLGVDTQKFSAPKDKKLAKTLLGFEEDAFILGYHGRISREKDLKTLFRAFIRLQSKYPKIRLLLVGEGLEEIKELFQKRRGCKVFSAQKDVEKFVQVMDVYVLTSLTETTSLTTLEALSCGVPVVATKVGFVKNYIVDGLNGFLINKGQPFELTKKLEKLINDPFLRKKFSKNGRLLVEQKFDWNKTAQQIENVFVDVLKKQKKF